MFNFLDRLKVYKKKYSWKRTGKINVDSSVLVFPETEMSVFDGYIRVGERSCIRGSLEVQRKGGKIEIGSNCYVGDHTRIWASDEIKIGNNVLIAHNVNIFDNDTHPTNYLERREDALNIIYRGVRNKYSSLRSLPVEIGDDVWIGCNSIILKGTVVGGGSIVAAGSVVTKSIPPFVLVAGNPARIIKYLNSE